MRNTFRLALCAMLALVVSAPASALSGGPDDFGYVFTDSNEAGGPAYAFEDIAATGTAVTLSDDQVSAPIAMGFSFTFYDQTHTDVSISSNGFLTFENGGSNGCCDGEAIPSGDAPNAVIAGWWEDLLPPTGGQILYQTLGTSPNQRFIVQLQGIFHISDDVNPITLQFKLFEGSNLIEVHYASTPVAPGNLYSAGIENHDGSMGLQYALTSAPLATPLAVRYTALPGLYVRPSANPTAVVAGDDVTFTVVVGNTADVADTGVTLQNTLPAGFTLVSVTPSQGTCAGTAPINCSIGTLAAASQATVTIVATASGEGFVSGTTAVAGTNVDPTPGNNSRSLTVLVLPTSLPTLYGTTSTKGPSRLVTIDTTSGDTTDIGEIGSSNVVRGLDTNPLTGQLFGLVDSDDELELVTFDAQTGAATTVGQTMLPNATDIAFQPGSAALWAHFFSNPPVLRGGPTQGSIATIDVTTAATTLVGPTGRSSSGVALAFSSPTQLRLADMLGLATVNLATGAAVTDGPFILPSNAASVVPVAMDAAPGSSLMYVLLQNFGGGGKGRKEGPADPDEQRGGGGAALGVIDTATRQLAIIGSTSNNLTALAFGPGASIEIAMTPATQTITIGATATFNVTLTNTGELPLTAVVATDAMVPDCDRNFAALAAGASETWSCTRTNVLADFDNVISVTSVAQTSPSTTAIVSDTSEIAAVIVQGSAAISLTIAPPTQTVTIGATANFQVTVLNNGQLPLTAVVITAPNAPDCARTIAALAIGEQVTYACSFANALADFTNAMAVNATSGVGPVGDNDSATVTVQGSASIALTVGPPTQTVASGGVATFQVTVVNSGQLALTSVVITAPNVPDCARTIPVLAIGAQVTYACSIANVTSDLTNPVAVTASSGVGAVSDNEAVVVVAGGVPVPVEPLIVPTLSNLMLMLLALSMIGVGLLAGARRNG